jgi:hypothetical protein
MIRDNRLKVYENMGLRFIFDTKRDEGTGDWRIMHNKKFHHLYSSQNIFGIIKLRMRWAEHVECMWARRSLYTFPLEKILGRPRQSLSDNIENVLEHI